MPITTITGQDLINLIAALNNPVGSTAGGDYKKVTSIEYNPLTGDLRISYES